MTQPPIALSEPDVAMSSEPRSESMLMIVTPIGRVFPDDISSVLHRTLSLTGVLPRREEHGCQLVVV